MAKWEYLTLGVGRDKKDKTWILERSDGEVLVGLNAILQSYGSEGWELLSLEAERFHIFPGFGKQYIDPFAYRATFKRPA